jgi:hypothetical protein
MATYDISVHCQDCGKVHPVLLRIDLDGGPDEKRSVADVFRGRLLPPQLTAIKGHSAFCHKTGRKFPLQKDDDIFLIPPVKFRRYSVVR